MTLSSTVAFDEASIDMQHSPFETRFEFLMLNVASEHPFIVSLYTINHNKLILFDPPYVTASRMLCKEHKRLARLARLVLKNGGEGIILRKPKSVYERGRSAFLLKLKVILKILFFIPESAQISLFLQRHHATMERHS
jgi:hypothetical protein